MGHPEPKTIKEPKVTVTVEVNYQEPVKFTDTVDMGEVPEGQYTPPPDADNVGSYTEPTILGSHHTISANFPTDQEIASPLTITQAGHYEIIANVKYEITNGACNNTIAIIKNMAIQTGVLNSDSFNNEAVGIIEHTVRYYLNNLAINDTISLNLNTSVSGNTNNSRVLLTAKKLQNAVTITPTSDSGGGGV